MAQEIARAIVVNDGRVLVLQNSDDDPKAYARGRWEFPGGWVEQDDDHEEQAMRREVEEETGLAVSVEQVIERVTVTEPGKDPLPAQYFLATTDSRDVSLSVEHQDHRWIDPATFKDMDWLLYAGYIIPLLRKYEEQIRSL